MNTLIFQPNSIASELDIMQIQTFNVIIEKILTPLEVAHEIDTTINLKKGTQFR